MEWMNYALSILSGLAVCIPLVIKLVEYVQKLIKERNWAKMLENVIDYMEIAEEKFTTGAERKEWVMAMAKEAADTIDYDLDMELIGEMIDNLCNMANIVNSPVNQEK